MDTKTTMQHGFELMRKGAFDKKKKKIARKMLWEGLKQKSREGKKWPESKGAKQLRKHLEE